jgi:hypothetical protein
MTAKFGLTLLLDYGLAGLRRLGLHQQVTVDEVGSFRDWADDVWHTALPEYEAVVRRDAVALDRLYQVGDSRLIKLRVRSTRGHTTIGWIAVTLDQKIEHPDYGNLRIGILADCFGHPKNAAPVLMAGVEYLAARGADLVQVTLSHANWIKAARRIGFLPVPTTTRFFASPTLAQDLPQVSSMHLTLGDNDGPIPASKQ